VDEGEGAAGGAEAGGGRVGGYVVFDQDLWGVFSLGSMWRVRDVWRGCRRSLSFAAANGPRHALMSNATLLLSSRAPAILREAAASAHHICFKGNERNTTYRDAMQWPNSTLPLVLPFIIKLLCSLEQKLPRCRLQHSPQIMIIPRYLVQIRLYQIHASQGTCIEQST
jgi:hypothetical protein